MKFIILALLMLSASASPIDSDGDSRIIDGELAQKGEFPYIVDIRVGNSHWCGGSIYNENWVITAAHCIAQPMESYTLVAGELDHSFDKGDEQRREATIFIEHETYFPPTLRDDIALIKVNESFVLGPNVQIISLNSEFIESGDCTVAGWGSISGDPDNPVYPDELYKVELPIVSDDACMALMVSATEKNICAGDILGGKSACYGDSGGPLVITRGNEDILAGIVSFGPTFCGSEFEYSVYCEVAHYVKWIEDTIEANSQ